MTVNNIKIIFFFLSIDNMLVMSKKKLLMYIVFVFFQIQIKVKKIAFTK